MILFLCFATIQTVSKLVKPGFSVLIEKGAGSPSYFSDAEYEAAGAKLVERDDIWKSSDIVMKVSLNVFGKSDQIICYMLYLTCFYDDDFINKQLRPPTKEEITLLEDRTLISFLYPAQNPELLQQLQDQKSTAFAMDCIPRTLSRGQTYDALSSQANISGYRAVVEAGNEFGRFFAGQMTAAGELTL